DPEAAGASEGRLVMQRLIRDQRPALVLWADTDRVLPLESVGRPFQRLFKTAEDLTVIRDAGHFLQEDQGDQVGWVIGDWLIRQPR
ncbi:MAG TPA: alpha/beta fold hydrolase, partial [Mycobacterium sp.]|nr:alpha/beta fold hydrolase [Mycobacterium sp.]